MLFRSKDGAENDITEFTQQRKYYEVSAFKDKRRTENNRYRYMFGENLNSKVQCKNRTADSKSFELLYGGYNGA